MNNVPQTHPLRKALSARESMRKGVRETILLPVTWLNLQRCRLASHLFSGRACDHYTQKKHVLREKFRRVSRNKTKYVASWWKSKLQFYISEEKHILLTFDGGQCWGAYVLLNSIFQNNISSRFVVHVIYKNLAEGFRTRFRDWIKKQRQGVRFYEFRDEDLAYCPTEPGDYITSVTYFRLWAAEYLSDDVTIVLYLDIDTHCVGDITQLFLPQINESACFATYGTAPPGRKVRLGLKPDDSYFQGGILRMNLKAWREGGYTEKMKKIITEKKKFPRWDQDVLNAMFVPEGRGIQYLPIKYNATDPFHSRKCLTSNNAFYLQFTLEDRKDAFLHPVIIHYTGFHKKPWFRNSGGNPYLCQVWLKYRKGTPAEEQELPLFIKKK